MSPPSETNDSPREYISISDSDSLDVAVSEDDGTMHRHPPSTIGPDDLKRLIEELVTPSRAKSTATQASRPLRPAPTDAALTPQPAPGVADADNAPVIDAEVTTVAAACLPEMMVYPSIEASDANMVNTSAINASSADSQAVGRNTGVLDGVVSVPSASKSPVLPVTIPAVPCSLDTPSSMLPPAVTNQCHKPTFGQPSALCGSMASPSHSDGTFPALFGQGSAASGIPGVSRFSCPPAPWGDGLSLLNQTVNSPPTPSLLVPNNQGMAPSFASSTSFQKEGTRPMLSNAPGTTVLSQTSIPAGRAAITPRELRPTKVLGEVNTAKLEDKDAMFYFGVICIQEHLTPSFEFLQYFDNKWVVRLRFGGHEVSKLQIYSTKAAATADACRDGLATLKTLMPLCVVPESPELGVSPNRLRWNSLLALYCQQRGIPDPLYTQYANFDGFRNEVEVDGLSFFGIEKCYPSIDEAIIACAHKALHYLLVTSGANGELMHGVAKSGTLPKVVGATPNLPNKPEPVTVDLTKFPFVPSAGTSVTTKRARRKGGRGRGKEASLADALKKVKGSERQYPQVPTAASATGANSVKVKAVEDTTNKKSTGKLVTPAFFNPSLMAQKPSTNHGVPDAAEFAQTIFFQCRMSGNRSMCRKDPCTASEFRLKLKSYGSDLLRVKSICDRLSIHPPDFPVKVFNVKGSPMHFEVDAFFHNDAALRNFRRIGFAKHQSKPEAELLCHQNTVAFLMEVMMGVNQLRGGNWIEEAALTDKTGFYL
ncbi:TPA_exp: Uncharacterized protein A8136_0624 [Trichophyton benhamiae CBS 112371]|nr:TPA_exp: Uncharacterized protein A8136_0624 [Trichophyton benhamiae CBS 112371]